MSQSFDASKSISTLDPDSTLIVVIEMSLTKWLVAAMVPGMARQPLKKIDADAEALSQLLCRWRGEATEAGKTLTRVVVAYEAGRDGFWLARWLLARNCEAYVIHASSVAVSREHRWAKTDRLDTELLMRAFLGWPFSVHSAHVGQELEVHYRYHPYFGRMVLVRRVELRAAGQFLKVQGPAGIVVSMAGWMLDREVCAGLSIGAPRVNAAALVELERLLKGAAHPAHSASDIAIVPEEGDGVSQGAGRCAGSADEPGVRDQQAGRARFARAGQGDLGSGTNPHAGRRLARRGA